MRYKGLLVLVCTICCVVYADNSQDIDKWLDNLEQEKSISSQNSTETYNNANNGSIELWLDDVEDDTYSEASFEEQQPIRKWAWELPTYSDLYPHLAKIPWLEANNVVDMTVIGQRKREKDNSDSYGLATYASFRPFALDFGTHSFAFGVSLVGRIGRVEDITKEVEAEAFDEFLAVDVVADGGQNHVNQIFINFSVLASFPEIGLQVIFDAGFGRSNLRQLINTIEGEIQVGGVPIVDALYEEYQYKQNDEALFGGINILKSFDRPYLNFFKLFIYGVYRINTKTRDSSAILTDLLEGEDGQFGKQDLAFDDLANTGNFFPDPAFPDEFNLSYFGVDFIARLYTFYTPLMKNRGISLSVAGGFRHVSGQLLIEDFHGLQSQLGGEVGIFDAVTFRVSAIFEEGNEQEDGYQFTLVVQLSAILREVFK
ncbi:hypothetical protein [Candidatus Uabimicrobium sp. HlEnr_7]|uniref:hypothetical protein n=1 Tax=Candidatus Uabimicrobium helgolandensis TaxID=3095367 RepID=UPI0035569B19